LLFGKVKAGKSKSVTFRIKGKNTGSLKQPKISLYLNGSRIIDYQNYLQVSKTSSGNDIEYRLSIQNKSKKRGAVHGEIAFTNTKEDGQLLLPMQGYFF